MKIKLLSILLLAFSGLSLNAQTNFQIEHQRFLENQITPFVRGNSEVFVLEGTAWERLYGEKEYVLMPLTQNIKEYSVRIRQLDNPTIGTIKSKFHFINVEVNSLSKVLLKNKNIYIPDYVASNVNIFLPEIDIDALIQNSISFTYLTNYGTVTGEINNPIESQAVLWSEGFELNEVPGTYYDATILGSANCGWGDGSCASHSGSWSVWCALDGPACNACGGSTLSDMNSEFFKINAINTSAYMDLWFKYWKWQDLNDFELTDNLERWTNLGSGWVLSATFLSNNPDDEVGWLQKTTFYSGSFPSFNFSFDYYSDGSLNADGIYLDDLELSGTPNSIEDINSISNMSIYPNPSNGLFTLELNSNVSTDLEINILNIMGQVAYTENLSSIYGRYKKQLDLIEFSKGVYMLQLKNGEGFINRKIVIE